MQVAELERNRGPQCYDRWHFWHAAVVLTVLWGGGNDVVRMRGQRRESWDLKIHYLVGVRTGSSVDSDATVDDTWILKFDCKLTMSQLTIRRHEPRPSRMKSLMKIQHHKTQIHFGRGNCHLESYQIQILISRIWSRTLKGSNIFCVCTDLQKQSLINHKISEFLGEILRISKNGDKITITPETAAWDSVVKNSKCMFFRIEE